VEHPRSGVGREGPESARLAHWPEPRRRPLDRTDTDRSARSRERSSSSQPTFPAGRKGSGEKQIAGITPRLTEQVSGARACGIAGTSAGPGKYSRLPSALRTARVMDRRQKPSERRRPTNSHRASLPSGSRPQPEGLKSRKEIRAIYLLQCRGPAPSQDLSARNIDYSCDRRGSPIAPNPGGGLLTEPTPAVRPCPRERVLMPQTGHWPDS